MALAGHGFELLGLSLFGPKPLEAVHLDLADGLSVLYGLNGSGKSTILREAEGVLRGVAPGQPGGVSSTQTCLHVRFTALDENPAVYERSQFEEAVVESFLGPEEPVDMPTFETRAEQWQWMLNYCLKQELDNEWIWDEPVLAHQESVTFCLVPIGTLDRPAWGSYVSAELSEMEWTALKEHREVQQRITDKALSTGTLSNADVKSLMSGTNPLAIFGETSWTRLAATKGAQENDYLNDWPAHFPLPLSPMGQLSVPPVHVISDTGSIAGTRDATNSLLVSLAEAHGELIEIADDSETRFNPQFINAVGRLEADANAFLKLTGPHFFKLGLELKSPHEWFVGEIPEWTASIQETSIGIGRLSGAELRWALAALQWALAGLDTTRPQVFLIDEPERGLHRMREQELPQMLRTLCTRSENLMVLAASHAPSFLDVRVGTKLRHVSRLQGFPTVLRPVDLGSSSLMSRSAESLGLSPSDLLQLTRVFVLVEGIHDEIVLSAALGSDLRRAGARIIPINGAGHARSIADARILFDATAASIVFVTDNVDSAPALKIWNQASREYLDGSRRTAKGTLARLTKLGPGGEPLWLQALGERAIDTNVLHRIKPFGLSKRDILCYLPSSAFMPSDASWEDLSTAFEQARSRGLTTENFKSWLTKMRGADFSRQNVEKAALHIGDSLPAELTQLSLVIQELGLMGPVDDLDADLKRSG